MSQSRFSYLVILAALAGTVRPAAAASVLNRTPIALAFHPKDATADGEPCLLLAQPIRPSGTRLSEFGSQPRTLATREEFDFLLEGKAGASRVLVVKNVAGRDLGQVLVVKERIKAVHGTPVEITKVRFTPVEGAEDLVDMSEDPEGFRVTLIQVPGGKDEQFPMSEEPAKPQAMDVSTDSLAAQEL